MMTPSEIILCILGLSIGSLCSWMFAKTLTQVMDGEWNGVKGLFSRKNDSCIPESSHAPRQESEDTQDNQQRDAEADILKLQCEALEANRDAWKAVQEMVSIARDLTLAEHQKE